MEDEGLGTSRYPPPLPADSDIDCSFTSTSTSSTTFTSSSYSSCCSARSSLSLAGDPRLSSSLLKPHPHQSSDPRWSAIRAAAALSPDGSLQLRHLKLLKPLGSGNLARVFHCRLLDDASSPDFALKVIDTDALARARDGEKLSHVWVEGEVLAALDHPFLPTLYARLESHRHTCFLIDYCSGGDLHSLLRRQPGGRFPLQVAKFYTAEVLLALEYLHASGYVYRDLKPENVLRRADGHLMLSDFDLCLKADVVPAVQNIEVVAPPTRRRRRKRKKKKGCCLGCGGAVESSEESSTATVTEFVAEPRTASSKECVGTHEYLAPEVLSRDGHGNGVDWWAFGVFLYEMLCGRTPFKGGNKESTLRNIKSKPLRFPEAMGGDDAGMAAARDLIERLLVKDSRRRLGSARGAADIKRHPFFDGIKWALIRSYPAPRVGGGGGGAGKRSLVRKGLALLGVGWKTRKVLRLSSTVVKSRQ